MLFCWKEFRGRKDQGHSLLHSLLASSIVKSVGKQYVGFLDRSTAIIGPFSAEMALASLANLVTSIVSQHFLFRTSRLASHAVVPVCTGCSQYFGGHHLTPRIGCSPMISHQEIFQNSICWHGKNNSEVPAGDYQKICAATIRIATNYVRNSKFCTHIIPLRVDMFFSLPYVLGLLAAAHAAPQVKIGKTTLTGSDITGLKLDFFGGMKFSISRISRNPSWLFTYRDPFCRTSSR